MELLGLKDFLEKNIVLLLLLSDNGDGGGHLHGVHQVGEGGGGQTHTLGPIHLKLRIRLKLETSDNLQ